MRRYFDSVASSITGLPVLNAQVRVFNGDGSAAAVYSDDGVTVMAQPVLTDALGGFYFYVADGTYTLTVDYPGSPTRTIPSVEIYSDVNDARAVLVQDGEDQPVLPATPPTTKYLTRQPDGSIGEQDSQTINIVNSLDDSTTDVAPSVAAVVDGLALKNNIADLASDDGATSVGWKSPGTGGNLSNVQTEIEYYEIPLERYFTGTLANGDDISQAWLRAIDAAYSKYVNFGTKSEVIVPTGTFNISQSIVHPTAVRSRGNGKIMTFIRQIGSFHSFVFGEPDPTTSVQCAGISDLWIYIDNGASMFINQDPSTWINRITDPTIAALMAYTPSQCRFERLQIMGHPICIEIQGGASSLIADVDTQGMWNDADSRAQQSIVSLKIDQDPSLTGSIPTWHRVERCRFAGSIIPSTTVTYPGGFTATSTKNIGPRDASILINAAEHLSIDASYTGGSGGDGIELAALSTKLMSAIQISNHFFDPCGTAEVNAQLKFTSLDSTSQIQGAAVTGAQFKGQTNGSRAISDFNNTSSYGSVKDLVVSGSATDFVCNPIELTNARRVSLDMTIGNYNINNFYTGDKACGVHVGSLCRSVSIKGAIGGALVGDPGSGPNYCIDGVRADNWIASRVTVSASNAGLSGRLFVGPPVQSATAGQTTNYTLTAKVDSPNQFHIATLTANITATLSATNAEDGDTFTISRTGAGAFTLTVSGFSTKALSQNQWVTFKYVVGIGWLEHSSGTI